MSFVTSHNTGPQENNQCAQKRDRPRTCFKKRFSISISLHSAAILLQGVTQTCSKSLLGICIAIMKLPDCIFLAHYHVGLKYLKQQFGVRNISTPPHRYYHTASWFENSAQNTPVQYQSCNFQMIFVKPETWKPFC